MLAIGPFTFTCSQHVLSSLLLQTPQSWSCNNFYCCKDTKDILATVKTLVTLLPVSPMQILTRSPPADKPQKYFFIFFPPQISFLSRSFLLRSVQILDGFTFTQTSSAEAYTSILQKPASPLSKASTIFSAAVCSSRVEVIRKINTLFQDQLLQIKECKLFCI